MRKRQALNDDRPAERIVAHYILERRLSDQLRYATRKNRSATYTEVYQKLFTSLPDHPQRSLNSQHSARVDVQLRRIAAHLQPQSVFLELGCGDAALGLAAAGKVRRVYGLDVTDSLIDFASTPPNFIFLHTTGVEIPLPAEEVDFAYSNQLLEHLHPEDAAEHLREVRRVLKPGGRYMCLTPSRVSGPHDISCYFDYEATCLHLREYDYASLRTLFREAGFRRVSCFSMIKGLQFHLSYLSIRTFERLLLALPAQLRARLTTPAPIHTLLGLNVVATK